MIIADSLRLHVAARQQQPRDLEPPGRDDELTGASTSNRRPSNVRTVALFTRCPATSRCSDRHVRMQQHAHIARASASDVRSARQNRSDS